MNSSGLWLPDPVGLSYEQREEVTSIAERLGGVGDDKHLGESAGRVARRRNP